MVQLFSMFCTGKNQYQNCVTSKSLMLMQVIIIFCILAIITSLFSFVLDIIAPRKKPLWKVLKRYAFGYVFTGITYTSILQIYLMVLREWLMHDVKKLWFFYKPLL